MKKLYEIGYIAGVFDLFHIGHLNLIRNAKAMCEYLIVGVLTDQLVIHFKNNPPIISGVERKGIVEALKDVDRAVFVDFENIDKMKAWEKYHFNCLFSGNDWEEHPSWIRDKKLLNMVGSDIHFFEYTQSTSSTRIKGLLSDRDTQKQRILIYGAGQYGKRALEYYGHNNIIGFIDRDERKIGMMLADKPIFNIEKIKNQLDEKYTIVIALKEEKEIVKEQLKKETNAIIEYYI